MNVLGVTSRHGNKLFSVYVLKYYIFITLINDFICKLFVTKKYLYLLANEKQPTQLYQQLSKYALSKITKNLSSDLN